MEIIVDATVSRVTVYPDRARVTCLGRCDLPQGLHQIVIGELPLLLDPESVRAAGSGSARVRMRGVDVVRRHYTDAPSAAVQALEKEIRKIDDRLSALADQRTVVQSSINHLDGLRSATTEFAWGLARGKSTTDNQASLMRFFESEDGRLRADLRDLTGTERELRDELDKLQRELNELRSAHPRQRYEVRLEIEAETSGSFEPEIRYVVSGAGWRPLYDVRLVEPGDANGGGKASVILQSLAEVQQNTGQPWLQVELSVSTARPAINQIVPELKPWFIDVPRPQPRPLRAAKMARDVNSVEMDAFEEMPTMALMAAAAPVVAVAEMAEVAENGTTVTFRVSGSVDIPGDNTPHKTTLGHYDLRPEIDYLAIPRHTNAVYRRAKFANTTGAPILPGSANLYVGDEYIGRNHLKYTPPAAELELVLGVEERIAVKRELVRRDVDKKLLRDTRQVVYGYEIEVENLLGSRLKLTVKDQYPVSRHDQIKARLDNVSPQPVEQTELNMIEWGMQLNPGQKEKIRFEYQIEHPRDLQVAGLID